MVIEGKAAAQDLIDAALQKVPCDLSVENIKYVNVFTGEIYPAVVDVVVDTVVRVRRPDERCALPSHTVFDGKGAYLIPGFIDSHVHVESTMMIPSNLSRAVVPWGTTTIMTDPHEIANVMGIDGVRFMIENSSHSALRQFILAPSCVPSAPGLETGGAIFDAPTVARLLDMERVVGVAELMDYPGVLSGSDRMRSILEEGARRGVFLQGHAPSLSGKELAAYRIAGPVSDHESSSGSEVLEKVRNGFHVDLRGGSIVSTFPDLLSGIRENRWHDMLSFCTDDRIATEIREKGTINDLVQRAVLAGLDPVEAVRIGTFNAAPEYGFTNLGAVAPGYIADFQLVRELDGGMPEAVFIGGKQVAGNGRDIAPDRTDAQHKHANTVHLTECLQEPDFRIPADGETADVAVLVPFLKAPILYNIAQERFPVRDGFVSIEGCSGICYAAVFNRYGNGARTVALTRLETAEGRFAFATTVSHDCHNIALLYNDESYALKAVHTLKESGGGLVLLHEDGMNVLPLPVAGLMSLSPIDELCDQITAIHDAIRALFGDGTNLLFASVFSLPCLPGAVITDLGIVDGATQSFIPVVNEV